MSGAVDETKDRFAQATINTSVEQSGFARRVVARYCARRRRVQTARQVVPTFHTAVPSGFFEPKASARSFRSQDRSLSKLSLVSSSTSRSRSRNGRTSDTTLLQSARRA